MPNPNVNRRVVLPNRGWPLPTPINYTMQNDFTSGSGHWVTVGNPFVTFASDGITFNGAPGGLSDYIYYDTYTNLDNQRFGFTATLTANSFIEFGFISRSIGVSPRGFAFELATGGNCTLYNIGSVSGAAPVSFGSARGAVTNHPTSPGDVIDCYVELDKSFVTIAKRINGGAWFTQTYNTLFYNFPATVNPANVCTPFLMNVNCNCKFTSVYVSTNENKNIARLAVGDSITQGFYAGSNAGRCAELISASINAGGAQQTQDILNTVPQLLLLNAQKVFLLAGLNDKANGVADATWQANLNSITSQLEARGTQVVHLTYGNFGASGIAVNNYVLATWPSKTIDTGAALNTVPGTINPIYDAGDGHPNAAGNTVMANTILASPLYLII